MRGTLWGELSYVEPDGRRSLAHGRSQCVGGPGVDRGTQTGMIESLSRCDSHFLGLSFPASFTAAWCDFGTTNYHCYKTVHEQQRLRSPGHPRVPHDRRQLHTRGMATCLSHRIGFPPARYEVLQNTAVGTASSIHLSKVPLYVVFLQVLFRSGINRGHGFVKLTGFTPKSR